MHMLIIKSSMNYLPNNSDGAILYFEGDSKENPQSLDGDSA